jgi:hypothetical protein
MVTQDHYVVNDKITLRQGDIFRAKAGPYYIARDEKGGKRRVPMAAKGPFRFVRYCEASKRKWIEAWSVKEGSIAILSLNGRRSLMPGVLIPRPYHITGRVSAKKAIKIAAKMAMKGKKPRRVKEQAAEAFAPPAKPARDTRQAAVDSVLAGLLPIAPFGG